MTTEFRRLPSVDRLLADGRLKALAQEYPHEVLVELARKRLERERGVVASGKTAASLDKIVEYIQTELSHLGQISLRPVINATGVILHTNLGRAPMSRETIAAMEIAASGYCNLEFDLERGDRGSRDVHLDPILCQLTGAEAGIVVNSNASAMLLALTTLARRKEVIVSRGEAVEIGGSFRIPDVMRQSGAKLIDVGATNCTYITDYEQAITPRTAAMLRVHSSNFQVVGFTHAVTIGEMTALGKRTGLPVIDDQGSGCFLDSTAFGLGAEPMVQQSVAAGVGLVCFSGDKLMGGPQAGIIVGKKELVDRLRKHPLYRASRIDKVRLAGLAATLIHYLKGEATRKIPVWMMISAPLAELEKRAAKWAEALGDLARVVDGESMIGGGSLPGSALPTKLVAIPGKKQGRNTSQALAQRLRADIPPIIGRVSEDALLLDPRSVPPEEDELVIKALLELRGLFELTDSK
ncbi:MAG: L-seryl-tRNA(Sec) selenium transferase [Chloroflexi bacterium]|nr:L-seryl-tRNA(Sec) selenium transferase [Chloroflexota bacterium]